MVLILAGVVLAAGAGTRLRPLTDLRPKALCPVGGVPLLDLALARISPMTGRGEAHLAVNAHHLGDRIAVHVQGRAHLSRESPHALGTAGALGALHDWIGGRDVLLTNADAYLPDGLPGFTAGWDGERCRLACTPADPADPADPAGAADFRTADGRGVRYVGACLLPWRLVRGLAATPSGLYEVLWRGAHERAELDLWLAPGIAMDCGTVADYLRANLHASGGKSVIGAGATVDGTTTRTVVWDGAVVGPGEQLVDVVRAGDAHQRLTVGGFSPTPA
ncbi:MAG TPA: NTP transferase domain-containing protein [Kineosporiaceae bacterium]|nr:NTP transferase domain-containing protein [Kineosporiaceae bacterium]